MPNAYGRAFTTANFLSNLAALKAINFGASDPSGVWFLVENPTGNSDIWLWQPTSTAATNETSVVRPDSIAPDSPGRCVKSLVDANSLGGILAAIAVLNTAGLIERTADGSASIVGLGSFARTFLGSTTDTAARTALNLGSVTNTSDAAKPVSTAQQTALNLKADLASPNFTGTPFVPTATAGTNTTQVANTAFVFAGLALKANLVSPAFTGTPTVPTATAGTSTTQAASTAFVGTAIATSITALIGTKLSIASNLSDLNNRQTALNTLAGGVTANRVLRGNGTNIALGQVDLATDVTGSLPAANGGLTSTSQTFSGDKKFTGIPQIQGLFPGFWLDETDSPNKGVYLVLDGGIFQIQRRATNFGVYEAAPFAFDIINGIATFNGTTQSTSTTTGAITATSMGLTGRLSANTGYFSTAFGAGNQTFDFTNSSIKSGVGTAGQDAVFSLHCSGTGLGVFGFDFSNPRFVIGANGGQAIDFCTNVGGTPGADNLASATPTMRIIGNNIVLSAIPTSSAGLTAGMIWRNGNLIYIV